MHYKGIWYQPRCGVSVWRRKLQIHLSLHIYVNILVSLINCSRIKLIYMHFILRKQTWLAYYIHFSEFCLWECDYVLTVLILLSLHFLPFVFFKQISFPMKKNLSEVLQSLINYNSVWCSIIQVKIANVKYWKVLLFLIAWLFRVLCHILLYLKTIMRPVIFNLVWCALSFLANCLHEWTKAYKNNNYTISCIVFS